MTFPEGPDKLLIIQTEICLQRYMFMANSVNNRTAAYLAILVAIILIIIAVAVTVFVGGSIIRPILLIIVAILMLGYAFMSYSGKV